MGNVFVIIVQCYIIIYKLLLSYVTLMPCMFDVNDCTLNVSHECVMGINNNNNNNKDLY